MTAAVPDEVQAYYESGWWDSSTFVSLIQKWADLDPDHAYVSDGVHRYSYGSFRDAAWNLAAALVELGVAKGDRIVVQLPNWSEFFLIYAACARVGAVMVPVVSVYRENEVRFIVENSGAVGFVTAGRFRGFDHATMAAGIAAAVPGLGWRVIVRGEPDAGALGWEALLSTAHDVAALPAASQITADEPHLVLYSSGTESRPKGCLHTWNSAAFLPKQAVVALEMGRDDVMFMPSPVAHTLGLTLGVMAPTIAGAHAHLVDIFDPATALDRISAYGCTGTASPAPLIRMMLDAFDPAVHNISGLRFWLTAGAAIPTSLVLEARQKWPACRIVPAYGSSEIMMATVCRPTDSPERIATSDGVAVPGAQLRIVGPDEQELGPDQDGEIRYRGPGRMMHYWNRPDLTAAGLDAQGWWRTGDLGRLDADGYLRVTGRIKDIIIRGGHNISAREIEEALLGHPSINGIAVIGLPDPKVGETACAVIVLTDGATAPTLPEIRRYLQDECRMAVWKIPERIEVVQTFPTTATGKIQKFALRDRLHLNT